MSDYPASINLCDGKYTIIYDFATGQSECLRYGQPWRQLVGDKMVLACFDEIVRLRAELAAATNKLEMAEAIIAGDGALITGLKNDLAAAPVVQPDMVLVPREPTETIVKAMEQQWMCGSQIDMAKREYRAMIAAAEGKSNAVADSRPD